MKKVYVSPKIEVLQLSSPSILVGSTESSSTMNWDDVYDESGSKEQYSLGNPWGIDWNANSDD